MATVSACPKCASTSLRLETIGFACGECDWLATPEHLMEL